ncbi:MAG: Na+/H+ antiporter subunit E [Verrucomicrobiae bacterium]|nr:Na+/H+ antiporter subunit E [Verrucomicrobiae bacterium]NNJ42848.1 Na+/H+ antiporter subunit E [Akkermansiaceae bacterium]
MKTRLSPTQKMIGWVRFAGFYLTEIFKSNLSIAWDVLTPEDKSSPGIIALDLPDGLSDAQILLISNLITMTPGSLSLDLCADRRTLLLHILYLDDVEKTRQHFLENYVHRVLHLS